MSEYQWWPDGWARTPDYRRRAWPNPMSHYRALQELGWEVERLGGSCLNVMTSTPPRKDGRPRARAIDNDPGVAAWFDLDGKQTVIACDTYDSIIGNMRAIAKTIEALRGLERWGSTEIGRRTMQAFEALPPPKTWRDILGVGLNATKDEIDAAYRSKARQHHPDFGGDHGLMAEVNAAYEQARVARS